MNILIRNTSAGRRAEKASDEEIKRLLSEGAAKMLSARIYQFVETPAKTVDPVVEVSEAEPVEDSDDIVNEEPAEYAHKDMTPKRRGRPPKAKE